MLAAKLLKSGWTGISLKKIADMFKKSQKSFTISLVALLLFSLRQDGFDRVMMTKAADLLGLDLSGNLKQDWLVLTKAVLSEIHPGGEIGRMLAGEDMICKEKSLERYFVSVSCKMTDIPA